MALLSVGVADLGVRFPDEDAGHWWDELEGRPILRVMSSLAADMVVTRCTDGFDSAIEIGAEALRLDRDDHLGTRGPWAALSGLEFPRSAPGGTCYLRTLTPVEPASWAGHELDAG